jgi:type I site-specific restriction-modification system R (restriction) subunit
MVESMSLSNPTEQLDRYRQTAPDLFVPNVLRVVSDGMLTRLGSLTSGPSRFMPWQPLADEGGAASAWENSKLDVGADGFEVRLALVFAHITALKFALPVI